ncbi:MAG: epimerase, partial [Ectothiorhodospiraceae bacterium]|nr:epimerase [Ectothiorhodospiraceae bacterium]
RGDEVVTEDSAPGNDFLADLCVQWEEAARPAEELGVRTVIFRIGLVLAEDGGLLEPLKPVFKIGLGGWLGNGKQWMSWIHRSDIAGVYLHALDDESMNGVYNACTPTPVRNKEFCKILGEAMNRPVLFPVPGFIPRLLKGEFGTVATEGQRVSSKRLEQSGYSYAYSDLKRAFEAVL